MKTDKNSIKALFFDCLKHYCKGFVVDKDNQKVITDIFHWCIRDKNGTLNPEKGLWIYGNIGTGKSTLMKAVILFVERYWLRDSGEKIRLSSTSAPDFCFKFATEGFSTFDSIPTGFDEVGTETLPTKYMGNNVNVVARMIETIYNDRPDIPKIATTNFRIKDVHDAYGARALDRIGELFNLVKVVGPSRRDADHIWKLLQEEDAMTAKKERVKKKS